MKMIRGLVAALAVVPSVLLIGGAAQATEGHWSEGAKTASGEPMMWLQNCPQELGQLGLKRCFSSRLVPQSVAIEHLARVHEYVQANLPDIQAGRPLAASSCGSQNQTPGTPVTTVPVGLGATGLAKAYLLNTAGLPDGTGKVVAIVDACGNSKAITDMNTYRTEYGLPALPQCTGTTLPTVGGTTPCMQVVSQTGSTTSVPKDDDNWAGEISLDVQMVSAACPKCSILLVEAKDADDSDLSTAETYAGAHADAVTNSYGSTEASGESTTGYVQSGKLLAAASGDNDWYNQISVDTSEADAAAWSATYSPAGPNSPASMATVLAIGGSMVMDDATSSRSYSDNVWSFKVTNPKLTGLYNKVVYGGGSGCSKYTARPSFQSGITTGTCTMRDSVDVSGPSDYTPVPAVSGGGGILEVDEGSWAQVVGTSAASPFVTGVLTRLGMAAGGIAGIYDKAADFNDVTASAAVTNNDPSGTCTNAVDCNSGTGWDGPTGLGTPNAALLAGLDAGAGNSSGSTTEDGGSTGDDDGSVGSSSGSTGGSSGSTGTSSGSTSDDGGSFGSSSGTTTSSSSGSFGSSSGTTGEDASASSSSSGGNGESSSGGNSGSGCAVGPAGSEDGSPLVPGLSLIGLGALIAVRVRRRK